MCFSLLELYVRSPKGGDWLVTFACNVTCYKSNIYTNEGSESSRSMWTARPRRCSIVLSVFQRIALSVTSQSDSRALRSEQCMSGREVSCVLTRLARDCVDNAVGSGKNFIVNRWIQVNHNFVGSPWIGGAHTSKVESSVRNEHSMCLNSCGVIYQARRECYITDKCYKSVATFTLHGLGHRRRTVLWWSAPMSPVSSVPTGQKRVFKRNCLCVPST
jgi:hypothetical protein